MKAKIWKILMISAVMATFSSTTALAATGGGENASNSAVVNSSMDEKQREIDNYLFGEHGKDLEKMGFKITSTFPTEEGYLQIGITPYKDKFADYLYELFGKDVIKVVEEDQSIPYNPNIAYTTAPGTSVAGAEGGIDPVEPADPDKVVTDPSKAAESGMATTSSDEPKAPDSEVNEGVYTTTGTDDVQNAEDLAADGKMVAYNTVSDVQDNEKNPASQLVIPIAIGAVIIAGGLVFTFRKRNGLGK